MNRHYVGHKFSLVHKHTYVLLVSFRKEQYSLDSLKISIVEMCIDMLYEVWTKDFDDLF